MEKVLQQFVKLAAKMIAAEVAKHLGEVRKPGEAAAEVLAAPAEVFVAECATERGADEWRKDCLAIINDIAPTHGPQLRKLFAAFDAKRLPELDAEKLPAFLAELVSLRDAN